MLKGWCKSTQVALPSRPLGKDNGSKEDTMYYFLFAVVVFLLVAACTTRFP
jgi:hypothetical protein